MQTQGLLLPHVFSLLSSPFISPLASISLDALSFYTLSVPVYLLVSDVQF